MKRILRNLMKILFILNLSMIYPEDFFPKAVPAFEVIESDVWLRHSPSNSATKVLKIPKGRLISGEPQGENFEGKAKWLGTYIGYIPLEAVRLSPKFETLIMQPPPAMCRPIKAKSKLICEFLQNTPNPIEFKIPKNTQYIMKIIDCSERSKISLESSIEKMMPSFETMEYNTFLLYVEKGTRNLQQFILSTSPYECH